MHEFGRNFGFLGDYEIEEGLNTVIHGEKVSKKIKITLFDIRLGT